MKRSPMPPRKAPMNRGAPLRKQSKKRKGEKAQRAEAVAIAGERAGWRCIAETLVPEVACWGPLDPDEYELRSARPGGHLDPANVQMLCRAHHSWKHDNPLEAARRGLRPFPRGEGA